MFKFSENENTEIMDTIQAISESFSERLTLESKELNTASTAVIVVDVINGFIEEGPLSDTRIRKIIQPIENLIQALDQAQLVFINDAHNEKSTEFDAFPQHCIKGSFESEIVEALNKYSNQAAVLEKNSTNGFVSEAFQTWFKTASKSVDNFILVGDCTDICIKQLALSIKTYFNECNAKKRIIVPVNSVETFHLDLTNHNAQLMNLMSLYDMELGGIEIIGAIE